MGDVIYVSTLLVEYNVSSYRNSFGTGIEEAIVRSTFLISYEDNFPCFNIFLRRK